QGEFRTPTGRAQLRAGEPGGIERRERSRRGRAESDGRQPHDGVVVGAHMEHDGRAVVARAGPAANGAARPSDPSAHSHIGAAPARFRSRQPAATQPIRRLRVSASPPFSRTVQPIAGKPSLRWSQVTVLSTFSFTTTRLFSI